MSHSELNSPDSSAVSPAKHGYREAARISVGTMPGMFAWGLVTGMAMVKSGLTIWQAFGMTFLVYAGSAQLASLPLIAANTPLWVVFATAIVVNLRFVIFSAAVGPHFAHLPWHRRLWYGYFNIDISMGFFLKRFPLHTGYDPATKVGFFAGIGYPNWYAWQFGSVIGILLASQIPQSWGIGFAGTLALLAIMIPLIANFAALSGVVVAAAVAVLAAGLPYRLGLLLAVILGMAVAMLVDTLAERKRWKEET